MTNKNRSAAEFPLPSATDRGLSDDAVIMRRFCEKDEIEDRSITFFQQKNQIFLRFQDAFLEANEIGWDGYDALKADPSSIRYAFHFLRELPYYFPAPEIAFDADGDVAVEWDYGPRRILSVRISRDGTVYYAGLINHSSFHGVEFLRESIPDMISLGIEQTIGAK